MITIPMIRGAFLSQEERKQIEILCKKKIPVREIARILKRPRSTIRNELLRNGGITHYDASSAHQRACELKKAN